MARPRVVAFYLSRASSSRSVGCVSTRTGTGRELSTYQGPRPFQPRRRVVVTGIGIVSPLGCSTSSSWQKLCSGQTGVRVRMSYCRNSGLISRRSAHVSYDLQAIDESLSAFSVNAAATVPKGDGEHQFSVSSIVDKATLRTGSPDYIAYALHAARQALLDAQLLRGEHASTPCGSPDGPLARALSASSYSPWRVGVSVGSGIGGIEETGTTAAQVYGAGGVGGERGGAVVSEAGIRRTSPFFVPRILANMAAGGVALAFGLRGPNLAPSTACASGAHALGDAARAIALGHADCMLAGGTEACIGPLALAGFSRAKALAVGSADRPWESSRPFDTGRAGFVLGEGAAVLCLEEAEAAEARGARIYAELRGFGASCDAWHVTSPPPDGSGALAAMLSALHDGGVEAGQLGYINAHATGTPTGDAVEATAIGRLLGSRITSSRLSQGSVSPVPASMPVPWSPPPSPLTAPASCTVSSTKGAVGHLLGAAGAIEAAFTILALHTGVLPATVNLTHPDPALPVDVAAFPSCHPTSGTSPNPEGRGIKYAMSNSFGFGGTNSSLVFGRTAGTMATVDEGSDISRKAVRRDHKSPKAALQGLAAAASASASATGGAGTGTGLSAQSVWAALPYAWRYTLASDVLYWAVLGGLLLFNPRYCLDLQYRLAHRYGWAGPSKEVASASLLLYMRTLGTVLLSLTAPAAYGAWHREGSFARWYSGMRILMGAGLAYILASEGYGRGGSSTYRVLWPFLGHTLWHAAALLASGPQFWDKILGGTGRASGSAATTDVQHLS